MKATLTLKLCVAALLLVAAQAVVAQNIYKCTQGGQLEYTDHPCPGGKGELIHQADDREVIDHYLNLGQVDVAKRYADAHHLDALYKDRLASYQQKMDDKAQQQADDAADRAAGRQKTRGNQAIADQSANTNRLLQTQNDALRQQNAEYADQLSQPAYNAPPPAYWGAVAPPYRDHDHDHKPPGPPPKPVFHPCTSARRWPGAVLSTLITLRLPKFAR